MLVLVLQFHDLHVNRLWEYELGTPWSISWLRLCSYSYRYGASTKMEVTAISTNGLMDK
ncbi:hypothetical protein LINGRAHAP2_LOCUS28998 [Linum grandiflorum]